MPTITDSSYLRALDRRVLIFDGAMGTNIQRHNPTAEDYGGKALEGCNDNLVLTRPDIIQSIHESFLAVGCDVVETCTFQSTPRRVSSSISAASASFTNFPPTSGSDSGKRPRSSTGWCGARCNVGAGR